MALTDKLRAIGDGFRSSRGTTAGLSLDEMAVLASEPLGSGSGGGASVETATVTLDYAETSYATVLDNGVITCKEFNDTIINNVVIGSIFTVRYKYMQNRR